MPVVSAVATLPADPALQARLLGVLHATDGVTVGPVQAGHRLPVVLESDDRSTDRALWRTVSSLHGLVHLELVTADFSDLDPSHLGGSADPARRPRRSPLSTQ